MMATARAGPVSVNTRAHSGEAATHRPATTAKSTSAKPMTDASSTRPGRQKRMYAPISIAMGMVMNSVEAAHGESLMALTTTSATTARRMIMIARTETMAIMPPRRLTSSRAIWPRDFPLRRSEQNRITKSWTQPPRTAPRISHSVPGR
jgi:hypothetical protein